MGRKQRAEPRWLLPMILGAGRLDRRDVGAIRVGEATTHVEVAADKAGAFLEAISPGRMLEKGVRVAPSEPPVEGASRPKAAKGRKPGPSGKPPRKPRRPDQER